MLTAPPVSAGDDSLPAAAALTYHDAVRQALAAPTVALAQRALELAKRQLAIASAPVRGELSGGYRWTSGERDPGVGEVIDLSTQGFDPIGLTLTSPILGLGPAGDAIERARADVRRAEAEVANAQRAAVIEVTAAFQGVVRAAESAALAEAEAELAALERRAGELRAAAGAATANEVARLANAEARAQQALQSAAFEQRSAQRSLELALGVPVAAVEPGLPHPAALLARGLDPLWESRSDVLAATLNLADTARSASATLREQLPSLSISVVHASGDADRSLQVAGAFDTRSLQPSLSISYDPDSGVPGVGPDGSSRSLSLGLALRVPLDPSVGHALSAARIASERAEAQLELVRARAELEVERREIEFVRALNDADFAARSAELALAELTNAEARFSAGTLSELAINRARLDVQRALLDLERTRDAARLAALRLLDALAADPTTLTNAQE